MSCSRAFTGNDSTPEIITISHDLCDRWIMGSLHLPRSRPGLTDGAIRSLILAADLAVWAVILWWLFHG